MAARRVAVTGRASKNKPKRARLAQPEQRAICRGARQTGAPESARHSPESRAARLEPGSHVRARNIRDCWPAPDSARISSRFRSVFPLTLRGSCILDGSGGTG
jgi:hypothetical protein